MNLYEKMQTVEPGRYAVALGAVVYDHSRTLGEKDTTLLIAVQTYLETLALKELEKEIEKEPWIKSVIGKKNVKI